MSLQSVIEILRKSEEFFAKKGVPNPKIDAQILLAKALKCKRLDLFLRFDDPVKEAELSVFREYARRRAKREPLQHILGEVEFFGLTLKCDRRALIVRPETEYLCEIITQKFAQKKDETIKILDLGTGSGAIILALKSFFKRAQCVAVDASQEALNLARENAQLCGLNVEFVKGSWFENVSGKFDIIVSNPPYLSEEEVEIAQDEVKFFDPKSALISGENGLKDLREILNAAQNFLSNNGEIFLECGQNQAESLAKEFADAYKVLIPLPDLTKRIRYLNVK